MMTPSKQKIQEIRQEMQAALNAIATKHGLEGFNIGTIRYDADSFRVPVEGKFLGGESQEMKTLRMNARILGFKEDICGAEIDYSNRKFKVLGMRRSNMVLEEGGKVYTAKVDSVKLTLKMQNSPLLAA